MAAGRVHDARLERPGDGSAVSLANDSSRRPSRLLRSLSPVLSSKPAAGGESDAEYVYLFQSGRAPIEFRIRVCGDVLCYRVGDADYSGGNAQAFLAVVAEVFR